jgi:hypothetical protein
VEECEITDIKVKPYFLSFSTKSLFLEQTPDKYVPDSLITNTETTAPVKFGI